MLDTVAQEDLLASSARLGAGLVDGLRRLEHPLVDHVRGVGLWVAVVLTEPVAAAWNASPARPASCSTSPAPRRSRLAPPLVVTQAQLDTFVAAFPEILAATKDAAQRRRVDR